MSNCMMNDSANKASCLYLSKSDHIVLWNNNSIKMQTQLFLESAAFPVDRISLGSNSSIYLVAVQMFFENCEVWVDGL